MSSLRRYEILVPLLFNDGTIVPEALNVNFRLLSLLLFLAQLAPAFADDPYDTTQPVGQIGTNSFTTPVNQFLTPAGRQIELPGLRPQAIASSPNGRWLAISGKSPELLLADARTGEILQHVRLPTARAAEPTPGNVTAHILGPDKDAEVSYTGLVFSPDGAHIFLSSVNGAIKVFTIDSAGKVAASESFSLPPATAPWRSIEIPAGLAFSSDGKRLYVVFNLSNRLAELDPQTGKVLRTWDVGVAPYDVVLLRNKAYVSNWGGRPPDSNSLTGPAGRGMRVRVDSVRFIASEGSVSVIDLAQSKNPAPATPAVSTIPVGLHPSAMALTPNGHYLVVANSASDTLSVIDTRKDRIIETVCVRQTPADLFGASPNALAFDRSGHMLFVCNGTQNAVAVVEFHPGESKLLGLIPVGWFPGAIRFDSPRNELYVANIKGVGYNRSLTSANGAFNTHQYHGTISIVPVPSKNRLAAQTAIALGNMRYPLLEAAALPPRPGQPARPVPERVGEPTVFKHVVYIIKENRTYDQVLGDVKSGNGDPSLCTFGERITPNQHQFVRQFVLLDNTYCSGILSADGHQWADTAFATDYMEKSFCGFPRSYPDGMEDSDIDALAYSPAGFLWDNTIAHGKTLRDYGEFGITVKAWADSSNHSPITFLDHWRDFTNRSQTIQISSRPAIESLRSYICKATVGWDLDIPDVFRARQFIAELKNFENSGDFPNLAIICLPDDHTSGTHPGSATPAAQVADNDLAFGQIVEAISHSRFWADTCIFAIEDDPQAGWDHVSGYRTTAYVISPYTKRHQVVSTQYNQTSLVRTIELMLGLPPMNQFDATATPLSDCFVDSPDLTPFTAETNNVPLDHVNPEPKKITNAILRREAQVSARLPLKLPDQCPEDVLNRILWHAMKGPLAPYPVWAITKVQDHD